MSNKLGIEKKAMSRVSDSERQSWTSIAFIWIGTMICIPMLLAGGMLSAGMSLKNVVIATVVGFAINCSIMILIGIQATDLGLPTAMCATKVFGDRGSSLFVSMVIAISQTGWFGIQTAVCAEAFNKLMGIWNINFPFWLSCIICGAVMLVTSIYGFNFIKILNYIAVPALAVICAYGVIYVGGVTGWAKIASFQPETFIPMSEAVSLMIGIVAVNSIICGDYARYSRSRGDTIKSTLIGVLPAAIAMTTVGFVMTIATGNPNITEVFASIGLPILSMLILILTTWTTNTGNSYTAGLAITKAFSLEDEKRPAVTLISGVIGIIVAITGLATALESFIGFMSGLVPPIAGVMIADYWIIGRGKAENWYPVKGFNWNGIIAWAIGSIAALFFSFFSPGLDGIIVCCIVYIILNTILGETVMAGQGKLAIDQVDNSVSSVDSSN